jgi:prepilin-type N-terminal cleavage/methylation domain-containing protein
LTFALALCDQKGDFLSKSNKTTQGNMNLPTSKKIHLPGSQCRPGFTLVEILTVVAIISILMAAGAIGIGNINGGKGVTSAVATCEALFQEARTIAISKNCNARVMVDRRNSSNDSYLRKIVIVHQKIDANGVIDPNAWVLANRAYELPKGTYFSNTYSTLENGTPIRPATLSGADIKPDFHGDYVFYEFNAEGISQDAGASFVLGSGVRPMSQEPKTAKAGAKDFGGFVVWRNGSTSLLRSPAQIQTPTLPSSDEPFNF